MGKSAPARRKTRSARGKPSRNSIGQQASVKAQTDLASVRKQIQDTVVRRALDMVEATISSAGDGQYGAMKYLFELVGLFPAIPEQEHSDDSLAQTLMRHLGLTESSSLQTAITKESFECTNTFPTVP